MTRKQHHFARLSLSGMRGRPDFIRLPPGGRKARRFAAQHHSGHDRRPGLWRPRLPRPPLPEDPESRQTSRAKHTLHRLPCQSHLRPHPGRPDVGTRPVQERRHPHHSGARTHDAQSHHHRPGLEKRGLHHRRLRQVAPRRRGSLSALQPGLRRIVHPRRGRHQSELCRQPEQPSRKRLLRRRHQAQQALRENKGVLHRRVFSAGSRAGSRTKRTRRTAPSSPISPPTRLTAHISSKTDTNSPIRTNVRKVRPPSSA